MTRVRSILVLAGAGLWMACSPSASGARAASTPTSPTAAPAATSNVCAPAQSSSGGPVTDPNGPYFHRVAVGTLRDGVTLDGVRHVLEHASVPDGVVAPDGRVLIYYVNGEDGGVWVALYAGGAATPIGPVSIDGVSRPLGVVDPDAHVVEGRVRLVYLAGFGPPQQGGARAMCLAESTDGVSFRSIGVALDAAGRTWTDPSVVRLGDGSWLMAVSDGTSTVLARSGDGRTFVSGDRLTYGGVPELALEEQGRVRLYVCVAGGIDSHVSSDGGRTWTPGGTVVSGQGLACDPSRVAGAGLFVYKTGS